MLDQNKNTMVENEEEVKLNETELETASEVAAVEEENVPENEEVNETLEGEGEQAESFLEVKEQAEKKAKGPFLRGLIATFVDEAIIGVVSVALLYLVDFILRVAGYFISEKISMAFIIFVAVSILYPIIMECTKGKTVGRSLV